MSQCARLPNFRKTTNTYRPVYDCQKYDLKMSAVSEAHQAGTSIEQHVTIAKQNTTTKYMLFHS